MRNIITLFITVCFLLLAAACLILIAQLKSANDDIAVLEYHKSALSRQYQKVNAELAEYQFQEIMSEPVVQEPAQHNWSSDLINAATVYVQEKDGDAAAHDYMDAVEENITSATHKHDLAAITAAIRYAENGGSGREYGILHPRVKPTYRSQAGWCAATVQKNWDRFIADGGSTDDIAGYIRFLGARYCPVGADNDPHGLNKHWVGNVVSHYSTILTLTK